MSWQRLNEFAKSGVLPGNASWFRRIVMNAPGPVGKPGIIPELL
jgi:hypothetical protein